MVKITCAKYNKQMSCCLFGYNRSAVDRVVFPFWDYKIVADMTKTVTGQNEREAWTTRTADVNWIVVKARAKTMGVRQARLEASSHMDQLDVILSVSGTNVRHAHYARDLARQFGSSSV